ncbi:hypothetical protein TWF788_005598 [Orbilia oligospora]|uniref:Uncharacterized protein n=1 Tax=Orbilia oligospora TaxID=2813651 RepID=A0A7C8K4V5_ORBOL|nr:hypothetical protein TWF788_005598 [Orbilia oligospora]
MEIQHPPPPLPSIPTLPSLSSPRFTPIAIAPKPSSPPSSSSSSTSTSSKLLTIPQTTMTTAATIPKTPPRELWTEPEKYDLLWSIILSTGLTATTIPWHKITLPRNHTQPSAQVVIQDIALGKHHITHPTFTPSNKAGVVMVASRDLQYTHHYHQYHHSNNGVNKRSEAIVRGSSKKRKLDDDNNGSADEEKKMDYDEKKKEVVREQEEKEKVPISRDFEDTRHYHHHHQHSSSLSSSSLSPPNSSISSPSSPISNPDHHHHQPSTTTTIAPTTAIPTTTTTKPKPRRRRSTSPPINLDLSNPQITSYLKSSGYMNEDGTPVKKRRGRPTKDPFGLSVTLKKQLMRMDPNAPPMKKRGRPRKRFLDIDNNNSIIKKSYSGGNGGMGRDDGSISPGLREAIEKIGEEMVEELLVQGRSMRDTDDDEDEEEEEDVESEGYDGEVSGVWEGDETGDEEEGDLRHKKVEDTATDGGNKPDHMTIDKRGEAGSSPIKAEERLLNKGGSVPIRKVEKMAVDNLVEKP